MDLFGALNEARAEHLLPLLRPHGGLDMIALSRAERNHARGFEGHDGFYEAVVARFPGQTSGECIAEGQQAPREVVAAWLSDLPHRQIVLGEYRYVGCGHSGNFWVSDFLGS